MGGVRGRVSLGSDWQPNVLRSALGKFTGVRFKKEIVRDRNVELGDLAGKDEVEAIHVNLWKKFERMT